MKINFLFSFLGLSFLISCSKPIQWISTTETQPWVKEKSPSYSSLANEPTLTIDTDCYLQTLDGFGACFNELGWISLEYLEKATRDNIFTELFSADTGANFTICRMPVGANDFSRGWYSYNETEGDFEMLNFSIENDHITLIPFIKEALKKNPGLRLWASPWSPPSWMKSNKHYACAVPWEGLSPEYRNDLPADRQGREGSNMFIMEDQYLKSYALYFSKFIEEYKKQGIHIEMVMPQNEFNSCQIFPSCTWTAGGLSIFTGKYLGPALEKQNTKIMFGTMERPDSRLVDTALNDPDASKYITGVGFQWAGKESIADIHMRYPGLTLYQTEQECGDGKNDWKHCLYSWSLMKHYLNNGANAYMYWNISLIKGGFSRWGWQQNSLITIDTLNRTYRYNHEYYLLKHFSHFIKPGARMLKTNGRSEEILAFKNPDGSIIVVFYSESEAEWIIQIDNQAIRCNAKSGSFNSILMHRQ